MAYTVGVSRKHIPWWFKRFTVASHEFKDGPIPRLVLSLADGSQIAVPGLEWRSIKVYPDYRAHKAQLDEFRKAEESAAHRAQQQLAVQSAEYEAFQRLKREAADGASGGILSP